MPFMSEVSKRRMITANMSNKAVRRKVKKAIEMLKNTTGEEHEFWARYLDCVILDKTQTFVVTVISVLDAPNAHLLIKESSFFSEKLFEYIKELREDEEEFRCYYQPIKESQKTEIKIGKKLYDAETLDYIIII